MAADGRHLGFFILKFALSTHIKGVLQWQKSLSEINVKLAEKNKYTTHSVQRSLEMCEIRKNRAFPKISDKKVLPVT